MRRPGDPAVMPQFVQQFTGKSYSFIEPRLDWARGKVAFIDGACGKLETIATPVIVSTDKYIDHTYDALTARASLVRTSVSRRVAPVQLRIGEAQDSLATRSLGLVHSSENLIDRLLPLPKRPMSDKDDEQAIDDAQLIYRMARLPFAVPMRVTMIMYIKANGAVDTMCLSTRQAADLACEKQNQFVEHVVQRAKPLTDRVADVRAASINKFRAGKDSAVRSVTVQVNNMVVRLHVVEAKNWSAETMSNLRSGSQNMVLAVVRGAHGLTTRVIGDQRAMIVFARLQLPLELAEGKSQ